MMEALSKAWSWLKLHWPVALAAITGTLGFIVAVLLVRPAPRTPAQAITRELTAQRDGELAARIAVDHGTAVAVKTLEDTHAETIAQLDAAQTAKYQALRSDPRALAAHLSRLSDDKS